MPRVNNQLDIPDHELSFQTSRSGGPGGQHANNTASRVQVSFDVAGSPSLTSSQRRRIQSKLSSRLTQDGVLQVAAQDHRSQHTNKELAVERLVALLRKALERPKRRFETRPSKAARRRRMDKKTRRGKLKKLRGKVRE